MPIDRFALAGLALCALAACAPMPGAAPAAEPLSAARIAEIVAAPERSEADRTNDQRRKPREMLAFIAVKPGSVALDLSAGGGYTTSCWRGRSAPAARLSGRARHPLCGHHRRSPRVRQRLLPWRRRAPRRAHRRHAWPPARRRWPRRARARSCPCRSPSRILCRRTWRAMRSTW